MKLHKCKAYSISSLIGWDICSDTYSSRASSEKRRYYVKEEELAAEEK